MKTKQLIKELLKFDGNVDVNIIKPYNIELRINKLSYNKVQNKIHIEAENID